MTYFCALLSYIYIYTYIGGGARQPSLGQDLLIHEVSRSHTHNDSPQAVGLLWMSDQPFAETYPFTY